MNAKLLTPIALGLIAIGAGAYTLRSNTANTAAPQQPTPVIAAAAEACEACASCAVAPVTDKWTSFITAADLQKRLNEPELLIIDVRSPEKYAAGHIPGAINLPGNDWRTPATKAGTPSSQYIFRTPDGKADIAKYEQYLSQAGVDNDHQIVIYGEHGGKADGTVPAMILSWLGHKNVQFLDGIGINQWQIAGGELSKETRKLPASQYKANPADGFLFPLSDVLANLNNKNVLFYDTRSPKEYSGEDKRDNARGGHIPGAVLCNYEEFLTPETRTTLPPAEVKKILEEKKITPEKKIVLYCQTATRVSHTYLALKDLGYTNLAIYDESWHEYGNRTDTPIETPEKAATAAQ